MMGLTDIGGGVWGVTLPVSSASLKAAAKAWTGVHVGCEHGVSGACTVLLDGAEITTIEGMATGEAMHPMQDAFKRNHGLRAASLGLHQAFSAGSQFPNLTRIRRQGSRLRRSVYASHP